MGTHSLTDPLDLKLAMKLSKNHFWSATNRQMYVRNLDLGGWGEWQPACFLLYNFWLTLICKIFLYLLPWAEMYRRFLVWFQSKLCYCSSNSSWKHEWPKIFSQFHRLQCRYWRCATSQFLLGVTHWCSWKLLPGRPTKCFSLKGSEIIFLDALYLEFLKTVWRHWQCCTAVLQGILIHVSHLGLTRGIQRMHDLWYVISMTTLFTCWFAISSLQQQQNSLTQT